MSDSCIGGGAHEYLLLDQPAVQRTCVLPRTLNAGATCDPSTSASFSKRALDEDWDATAPAPQQRPSIGFILQAIIDDHFTFQ